MVSDSISNSSVTALASNARDSSKKKRTNRSAKLKQCKLDARREQWLSQVKSKGVKGEENEDREPPMRAHNEGTGVLENLEMDKHHDSKWHSSLNSPSSVLGSNDTGTNYTGSSSSTNSVGCYSGSITDEEEEDDGCLDDWEAVADALTADEIEIQLNLSHPGTSIVQSNISHELINQNKLQSADPECVKGPRRAWRSDDVFRPQSLPNLSKQHSFPMNSERHYGLKVANTGTSKSSVNVPTTCPICCEDLDMTDTSFVPCPCGFRLCLFCHKRILEDDGRCPGCRKTYNQEHAKGEASMNGGSLTVRFARSFSMITRS